MPTSACTSSMPQLLSSENPIRMKQLYSLARTRARSHLGRLVETLKKENA